MTFQPIEQNDSQMLALQAIYRAFGADERDAAMPASGSCKDNKSGIRWNWNIEKKKGSVNTRLFKNVFRGPLKSSITFTIPLGIRDVNDSGLVARDQSGATYLCRQRYGKDNILGGTLADPFAPGWTGEAYPSFNVIGAPSTRTYHACIPLDRGDDVIVDALLSLLKHLSKLPKRATENEARKIMSDYFNINRHTWSAEEQHIVRSHRDMLLKLLQDGMVAEEAFAQVLKKK